MRTRMKTPEALKIADRAETATEQEVNDAYYCLMIDAPVWAFTDDLEQKRDQLRRIVEGPQE